MVKKLFLMLLPVVLACSLSSLTFAQAETGTKDSAKDAKKEAKAEKKARWEGVIARSNKEKSTFTVRRRGTQTERTVAYDSATQFVSQEHGSKKTNKIDPSDVKDGDRIIAVGSWDKDGVLHATLISKRLTP